MDRSGSHFGLDDQQWDQAKAEVREAIMDAAYDRRMTWYGEVASKVTAVPLDPYTSLMNNLLGVFDEERVLPAAVPPGRVPGPARCQA
jgi:hypothetical protein